PFGRGYPHDEFPNTGAQLILGSAPTSSRRFRSPLREIGWWRCCPDTSPHSNNRRPIEIGWRRLVNVTASALLLACPISAKQCLINNVQGKSDDDRQPQ